MLVGDTTSDDSTSMIQTKRASNSTIRVASSDATTTNFAAIDLAPANSTLGGSITCTADGTFSGSSNQNAHLKFGVTSGGSHDTKMLLDSSGNVGIGLTNPHLYYAPNLVVKAPSEGGITIRNTGANDWNYIMFASGDSGNTRYDSYIGVDHGNNKVRISTNESVSAKNVELRSDGNFHISDGNVVFASGHGIDFSAAPNSGGMNSELLDRYEEGTWTPQWAGSGGTGTFGYHTQIGKYTRIGRHVFFTWVIIANSHSGTTSGAIRVAGLPFAVDASESPSGGTVFFIIGFNASFNTPVVTQLNSSEEIEFYHQVQGSGANYNSVSASAMSLGSLYAKGAGHYIS